MEDRKALAKELGLVKADRANKALIVITLIAVIGSIGVSALVFLGTSNKVSNLEKRVVVLDNDGALKTGTIKELNEFERQKLLAENVLRIGVEYMYSFSSANYDERIENARAYYGKSGNEILQGYLNDRVREKVIQNNLRVDVVIRSIEVMNENNGVAGKVVFEQSFINGDAVSKRVLTASCVFAEAQISNKNAYGMVIENWIIENQE